MRPFRVRSFSSPGVEDLEPNEPHERKTVHVAVEQLQSSRGFRPVEVASAGFHSDAGKKVKVAVSGVVTTIPNVISRPGQALCDAY